jgi:hypothetical protein
MTIVPIPLENSKSPEAYLEQGYVGEVPRPKQCFNPQCGLQEPLRKHGKYIRRVIHWGLCFLVEILRFRCRRCGKTSSCPYGWLVPYRRFAADLVMAGIEAYASRNVTYLDLSLDLSETHGAEEKLDIKELEQCCSLEPKADDSDEPKSRPASTTVFYWVDFMCKRIEALLTQMQKELVQGMKRGKQSYKPAGMKAVESLVENPNSYKAGSVEKAKMLNRLSFTMIVGQQLLGQSQEQWCRLRAYFLTAAETCNDVLTDKRVWLSATQSFEPGNF